MRFAMLAWFSSARGYSFIVINAHGFHFLTFAIFTAATAAAGD
jgi:hypothetical protein